jgi:hypothetical protein
VLQSSFGGCPEEEVRECCAQGAVRGYVSRIRIAVAAGLLRVLYDQDPAHPPAVSHQWSASSPFGLFHMQKRAAKGTNRAAIVARNSPKRVLPGVLWCRALARKAGSTRIRRDAYDREACSRRARRPRDGHLAIAMEVEASTLSESRHEVISTAETNAVRMV